MAYKDITEETVYLCVGHPTPNDIKTIINWLMSVELFQECFESKWLDLNWSNIYRKNHFWAAEVIFLYGNYNSSLTSIL